MWCAGIKKNEDIQVIKEHSSHKNRLLTIKPRTNTNSPKKMPHLQNKIRNRSIKNNSILTIHTQNQILLQKMMEINSRTPKFQENEDSTTSARSLNINTRTQFMNKITEENQQMLNRLQTIKSSYSTKKWDRDYQYKRYLSQKLSENSRRIPRVSSLGGPSYEVSKTPTSRPDTGSLKYQRPSTSTSTRIKQSYFEI
ncbi:hypothetical protein SteCoe_4381 [Stentor coeruleus]|uniref:Cilia- and flagella-associated protein 97 n=1 Tax=Stentor coeruleus TaxID=5963 RepID=A0A1R2CUW6_9CILI|nr:hypothetical protein SteCoe_4381 [Stentor coeruleus]